MQDGYFYGHVELGDAISAWVQASASGVVETPDSAPTATIYGPDGTELAGVSGAGTQTDSKTGFYRRSITASGANGFERGATYTVRWSWTISTGATSKAAIGTFVVT